MGRIRAYWRLIVVTLRFLPIFISYARDRRKYLLFGGPRSVDSDTKKDRAEKIRDTMLALGPTFIKLGQVLSTRPDVLPPEYTDVFSSLQDDVPAAEWKNVKQVIERELNAEVDEKYDDFEKEAISGASLGQVHTAKVDGQKVAVKVRRPGIKRQVEADVQVLEWLTPVLIQFVGQARAFSIETLADEFSETLIQEMDYKRERDELELIRDNFEENEKIIIPEPIDTHCSDKVLTMEYIGGTKIDNIQEIERMGLNRNELAERLQRAYFKMIIEDGVFHADPHPGNLAVKQDGSIIFYDFGMTGRIDEKTRDKIIEFYASVAADDAQGALDALVDMEIMDPDADRELMVDVLQLAIKDARGEEVEQRKVEDILRRVESQLYQFPFRLPPRFSLLLRVATIANGVCLTLNPNLDFISVITELLKENGYLEDSVRMVVKKRTKQFEESLEKLSDFPDRLDKTMRKINEGDLEASISVKNRELFKNLAKQILKSVLVSGLVVSGTILYAFVGLEEAFVPLLIAGLLTISLIWSLVNIEE